MYHKGDHVPYNYKISYFYPLPIYGYFFLHLELGVGEQIGRDPPPKKKFLEFIENLFFFFSGEFYNMGGIIAKKRSLMHVL